jgi:lipoyl(octanoyl) transferase
MITSTINVRLLGQQQDYTSCWQAMRDFTDTRDEQTMDEIWLLEHAPVFTQGQNGKAENLLNPGNIPVIQTDRGGQITYHGPGQLMLYILVDLRRKKLNVRELVTILERAVIDLLAEHQINAEAKSDAPGVYVQGKKICSIGLRIRRGCSYHGIAFNVAMDLEPFTRINPCGFSGLQMTQFFELGGLACTEQSGRKLVNYLMKTLGYTSVNYL